MTPLAARMRHVQHRIHHHLQVGTERRAPLTGTAQQRLEDHPLLVVQVTRIGHQTVIEPVGSGLEPTGTGQTQLAEYVPLQIRAAGQRATGQDSW